MKRFATGILLLWLLWAGAALAQAQKAPAQPLQKGPSFEGITEHRLANGMRVLTLPDPGVDTITVHIVYMVGSRHEGYGEKGMAHLLEHLLFKGTTRHPNLKDELVRRGARWNGTTSTDRTTYFETFAATEENLDWAISLEADRMVNSRVLREDLDSEMTVVRNEFESGENNPGGVLFQRMQQLAFPWHNYGNAIIGSRSDIEQVPIDRLQAFYRTWYQPDNALLLVAGRFDEKRALQAVAKYFGAIPPPSRALPRLYTREPTQDGERQVTLRRAGDNQLVMSLYRVPAGSHPDYPAVDVLVQVLGDAPTGRLHRMLVQKGLASGAWGSERALHDPGYMSFGATLDKSAQMAPARAALLEAVEGVVKDGVPQAEFERARTRLLNDFEKAQLDTQALVRALSEFQATGDWRLYFLYRERLRKVSLEDVRRVAATYLKPANRVVGEFVPTAAPDRAAIPEVEGLQQTLAELKPADESVRMGESFEPSPKNIEARVIRKQLANGISAAFLPKKTRGGRVVATLTLHWGDEKSLTHRDAACSFAGAMLTRGTLKHSRAELKDAFERINAAYSIGGDGANIEVKRENLAAALRLAAEALREPSFPASEFEEMKRASLTGAEAQKSDPGALAGVRLARHLYAYPEGHPHYTPTIEERIEWMRKATLQDAQKCYRELFGATGADLAVVGEFDPEEAARLAEELFGDWKTPRPFERVPARYFDRPRFENGVDTPDKANAVLRGGLNLRMRDDHPDFPAMVLANHLLGGSSVARVPARVREKEGLSYSTFTSFTSSAFDESASFRVSAIYAPQNRARVESAISEEIVRAVREGFSAAEVESGKKSLLEARRMQRTQDHALASRLGSYLFAKRTFEWDIEFESRISALTPGQVNAALRRHIDPDRISVVTAGAFKK